MNKNSLVLLPIAALFLAGCNNTPAESDTTSSETPSSSTSSSSSETPSSSSTSETVTVNYGTVDAPLSIAEFNTEADKLDLGNEDFSAEHFFVKGYVVDVPTFYSSTSTYKLKLTDGKNDTTYINVNGVKIDTGVEVPCQNDTVVVKGLAEFYNGKYSIWYTESDFPELKSVTRGTSTVTSSIENGTIAGLETSYTNGATATFTVTADEGYTITQVFAYGNALEAVDGQYSFVVAGDAVVNVILSKDGETVSYLAKYDFSSLTGTGTEFSTTTFKTAFANSYVSGSSGNVVSEVTTVTKVSNGNGSGGAHENEKGLIKFGTSKVNGTFAITLTKEVNKVTLNYHDFYKSSADYSSTKNTFTINDVTKANPYNATAAGEDVVFELATASNTLTFTANGRAVVFSMILE